MTWSKPPKILQLSPNAFTAARYGKKLHKYRAKRTTVGEKTFESKAEARRYQELLLLERAGKIRKLTCQPKYRLWTSTIMGGPQQVKIGNRLAFAIFDFQYVDDHGRTHVEDVKGRDLPVSRLKRAIVEQSYGIQVEIVK